jgi:hypothetical protein
VTRNEDEILALEHGLLGIDVPLGLLAFADEVFN